MLDLFAPDLAKLLQRFPFPTLLLAAATLVFVSVTGEWGWFDDETSFRLIAGILTAAIFAAAGRLFSESRPADKKIAGLLLEYALPVVIIGVFQLRETDWVLPFPLFAVGIFWLSVSPFTKPERGEARREVQNRFWWANHRAVTTAIIAVVGFTLISAGIAAIQQSLSLLFGLQTEDIFFRYVLPAIGMFFTPVYWLSTVPDLKEYEEGALDKPDFLSLAIGFLGQFVLVPLLLVYALILLAYAVQIVLTQSLPEGTLGWMVLGFVITGAANWLVLYPPFMHKRRLVRLFRMSWFWLTIIPIVLFAIGVWIRVDAYGLTTMRLALIAGGIWAVLLSLAFLSRKFADIRLIPALAGLVLVVMSVGPWNFDNAARLNQAARLETALDAVGWTADSTDIAWSEQQGETVRESIHYLTRNDGDDEVARVLFARGFDYDAWQQEGAGDLFVKMNIPLDATGSRSTAYLGQPVPADPVDTSATPLYLGQLNFGEGSPADVGGITFRVDDGDITILRGELELGRIDIADWVSRQSDEYILDPLMRVEGPGQVIQILPTVATIGKDPDRPRLIYLAALVLADRVVEATAMPSSPAPSAPDQ